MLIITDVLSSDDVARVRAELKGISLVDGKKTAGGEARKVKANRQADADDPKVKALMKVVRQALDRNAIFQLYARPATISGVMFNAYGPGETYGLHVDETIMGAGANKMRTDFSFTLMLADPAEYEGGELVVVGTEGDRSVKPRAGSMVVYSTGALHRVNPVTKGERLAAVGWVQSLIRRADAREVMFDLGRVRIGMAEGDGRLLLDKAMANLMRMWGEL
jgi:PKHD-type hydroxylase